MGLHDEAMPCCGCFEGVQKTRGGGLVQRISHMLDLRQKSKAEDDGYRDSLEFIETVPLFKSVEPSLHPLLAKALHTEVFLDGDQIMEQGESGTDLYIVQEGAAKMLVNGKDKMALGPGDYFGEKGLLANAPRHGTVIANGKIKLLVLSQDNFKKLGLVGKLRFKTRRVPSLIPNSHARSTSHLPHEKTPEEASQILDAMRNNRTVGEFLKRVSDDDLKDVVAQTYLMDVDAKKVIYRQGDVNADLFYIVKEGECDVFENKKLITTLQPGQGFGGLALLHQSPRRTTIQAKSAAVLWCVTRAQMRVALKDEAQKKIEKYAKVLGQVDFLKALSPEELRQLADVLVEVTYYKGENITEQGDEEATAVFILLSGTLSVLRDGQEETCWRPVADRLPLFGSKALLEDVAHVCTVKVSSEKANVLTLDRASFLKVMRPLIKAPHPSDWVKYSLDRLETVGFLGRGGFGKVTLVKDTITGNRLALKELSKGHLIAQNEEDAVINEKTIMRKTSSPFLVQLAATFNRGDYLYVLMEAVLGGELYDTFNNRHLYGQHELVMFYAACVVKGFQHLHERFIVYRDLKPENLVLDQKGYCKITDFGLAKFVMGKTFTNVGTPDYLAPEVIAGTGHACSVDWWTLGILIYELIMSAPPFTADNDAAIFRNIAKGIETADFPPIRSSWVDLVQELCRPDPSERLAVRPGGIANVENHRWFSRIEFDWDALANREMRAPYLPDVDENQPACREDDGANKEPTAYVDPGNGWDENFEDTWGPSKFD